MAQQAWWYETKKERLLGRLRDGYSLGTGRIGRSDQRGSGREEIDCAFLAVPPAAREYESFGQIIPNSPTGTWPGRFGYQGQAWIEIFSANGSQRLLLSPTRIYDPATGRFLQRDPIKFEVIQKRAKRLVKQSQYPDKLGDGHFEPFTSPFDFENLLSDESSLGDSIIVQLGDYLFSGNAPTQFVDPQGLDIAIIENGPTGGNPIGHTAIAISGRGVFSFGNSSPCGRSLLSYALREAPRRDTSIYIVKTTMAQDDAAFACVMKICASGREKKMGIGSENCATFSNECLDAAGIPQLRGKDIPGSAGARGWLAKGAYFWIQQGTGSLPNEFRLFDSYKDSWRPNQGFGR